MANKDFEFENEPIFPDESHLIIGKILTEYGIIKNLDEEKNKIAKLIQGKESDSKEKNLTVDDFPSVKLANIVADYGYKKITLEKLSARIEKELSIDREKSEKITGELKKNLLDSISFGNKANTRKKRTTTQEDRVFISEDRIKPSATPDKEKSFSSKKDTYRESLE